MAIPVIDIRLKKNNFKLYFDMNLMFRCKLVKWQCIIQSVHISMLIAALDSLFVQNDIVKNFTFVFKITFF